MQDIIDNIPHLNKQELELVRKYINDQLAIIAERERLLIKLKGFK